MILATLPNSRIARKLFQRKKKGCRTCQSGNLNMLWVMVNKLIPVVFRLERTILSHANIVGLFG